MVLRAPWLKEDRTGENRAGATPAGTGRRGKNSHLRFPPASIGTSLQGCCIRGPSPRLALFQSEYPELLQTAPWSFTELSLGTFLTA